MVKQVHREGLWIVKRGTVGCNALYVSMLGKRRRWGEVGIGGLDYGGSTQVLKYLP